MGLLRFYGNITYQRLKYGYDDMPMEKELRTNETDFCKDNYTECVRQCISNTVCNPQFRT